MAFEFHEGKYPHEKLDLRAAVFQAIGAASGCWSRMQDAGRFNDEAATKVGEALIEFVETRYKPSEQRQALLGLASTQELIDEITARIEIDGYNGGGGLNYRTADTPVNVVVNTYNETKPQQGGH